MYYENIEPLEESDELEYLNSLEEETEELPQYTLEELSKLPEEEVQDIFKDDLKGDEDDIAN